MSRVCEPLEPNCFSVGLAHKWKPGKAMYKRRQGGNGLGIGYLGAMYTLNTIDRHIAAICGGEPFRQAYIRRVCDGKDGTLIRFERRGL